jgi:hypothetical protein
MSALSAALPLPPCSLTSEWQSLDEKYGKDKGDSTRRAKTDKGEHDDKIYKKEKIEGCWLEAPPATFSLRPEGYTEKGAVSWSSEMRENPLKILF